VTPDSAPHSLWNEIPAMLWRTDSRFRLVSVSRTAAEYMGLSLGDDLDGQFAGCVHPDDSERVRDRFANPGNLREPFRCTFRVRPAIGTNAEYRRILENGAPFFGLDGEFRGFAGLWSDITEQVENERLLRELDETLELRVHERTATLNRTIRVLEREVRENAVLGEVLRVSRDAAEKASAAKSEFLSNMSHEIRTPLNTIIGMTTLALRDTREPKTRRALEAVKTAALHLMELVNDVLDYSRIEAGRMDIRGRAFMLRALVDEVLDIVTPQAIRKGIAVTVRVDPETPDYIRCDPLRLRQILLNVLGNAVKFTEKGRISLRVELGETFPDGTDLEFEVGDTGPGIDPAKLSSLFNPFSPLDVSPSKHYSGTGLGLAISKRLAEAMNGRIDVSSVSGNGTTVRFSVRCTLIDPRDDRNVSGTTVTFADVDSGEKLRVLVLDDDPFGRAVVGGYLEETGWTVDSASTGQEALELHEKRPYDLILTDIQLPGMDGFLTARKLRNIDGKRGRRTLIVALTAYAMEGDRERCLSEGMDGYLSKPVVPGTLFETLRPLLAKRAPAVSAAMPSVLRNDGMFFVQLIDTFLSGMTLLRRELDEARNSDDTDRLAFVCHRIRGSASYLDLHVCAELAERAERAAAAGETDRLAEILSSLAPRIDEAIAMARKMRDEVESPEGREE
jgi:PAS domain S-box-containing protein